jgi:hypothetical protein
MTKDRQLAVLDAAVEPEGGRTVAGEDGGCHLRVYPNAVYYHYECVNAACPDAVVIDVRTSGKRPSPPCTTCGQILEWSASTPCNLDGRARDPWILAPRLRLTTTRPTQKDG